jgi:hypothetical protein
VRLGSLLIAMILARRSAWLSMVPAALHSTGVAHSNAICQLQGLQLGAASMDAEAVL